MVPKLNVLSSLNSHRLLAVKMENQFFGADVANWRGCHFPIYRQLAPTELIFPIYRQLTLISSD